MTSLPAPSKSPVVLFSCPALYLLLFPWFPVAITLICPPFSRLPLTFPPPFSPFFLSVSCYIMSLFWFCSSNLWFDLYFFMFSRVFVLKASLSFTLVVLPRFLFRSSSLLPCRLSFSSHSSDLLSFLLSSLLGGVSWEGQLIYAPKKGTNIWLQPCAQPCRDICLLSVN